MDQMIKTLDVVIHFVAILFGAIIAGAVSRQLPYMYIGQAFMIFCCLTSVCYILFRMVLCITFKPIIKAKIRRMGN